MTENNDLALQEQPTTDAPALANLTPEEAMQALSGNPVAFIREIVDQAANQHLQTLKEQAELRGALAAFRKAHPDAQQFEPFILQEAAQLIQDDPDGVIDPWDKLLEKALDVFKQKFKATLKANPELIDRQSGEKTDRQMEGRNNRKPPQASPSFSRDQISKMSLTEFVAQEEAINEAMRNNRIR